MLVVSEAKTKYPNAENFRLSDAVLHLIFLLQFFQLSKSSLWGAVEKLFPCSILNTF